MNPYKLQTYSISEIGPTRKNNEDVYLEMPEHAFFALADGMGGHNAGEVAAHEAIINLSEEIEKLTLTEPWALHPLISHIQKAVCDANTWVYHLSQNHPSFSGMGTTLSCFLIHKESLLFAHVGDSRLYRYRDGRLEQLTEDHSLRAQLLKKGKLSPEEAHTFPKRNVVTRAVGTTKEILPDVGTTPIHSGDIYFLCSDGLSDHLRDGEMELIFQNHSSIEEISQKLVQAALNNGGKDNITIVMVKVH